VRRAAIYSAILAASAIVSNAAGAQTDASGVALVVAQSSDPFSALVGKKRQRPTARAKRITIERYVLASDDRALLFEDRSNEARVQFLCGPGDPRFDCTIDPEDPAAEIYQIKPTRGPRGDLIYKNAEGDTMMRIASYGGATVFWPGETRGLAASKSFGDDASLRLDFADYATAMRRAQAATAYVSAATGAPIIFDLGAPPLTDHENAAVLGDAIIRAANGIKDVADDPTGARIIASRIKKVSFSAASAPGLGFAAGVLNIRYVPGQDIDGRPSSAAVAHFLEETL
jgi:Domain of unknown function (DUF4908)